MLHAYRLHLLLLFLLLPCTLSAQQKLPAARQYSYLTKVFRLTAEQTRHLYEHDLRAARPEFFTQPVDSFPTDSLQRGLRRPLPRGYYLVAHTEGPELVYWLRTVSNQQLTVLDNQVDLTLVVRDSLGRLLPDARVWLGRGQHPQAVPFDAATQTYRMPGKAGRAGLLAVEQGGSTTYYALEQTFPYEQNRGWRWSGRRVMNRVVYGFPLGYLTRPVRKLVGELRHVSYVSTGLIGLVRSPFSEDVREERQDRREEKRAQRTHRWTGYLVLSQPRYRPGDTLRLKARVLRRKDGRPYRKPLALWLTGTERHKPVTLLRPVRPGTYEYALPLGDTLGLRLDRTVGVTLDDPKNEDADEILSAGFRYEDYELQRTRFTLRAGQNPHRWGVPQALFLRGQDANELNLLDARVRLSVTPQGSAGHFPGRQVFVPDTLWTRAQSLDATGETRLNLPATALPAADLTYLVQATFLNGDNERRVQTLSVPYSLDSARLVLELRQDSVVARYVVGEKSRSHAATLAVQGLGATEAAAALAGPVQLPLAFPVDARATEYHLQDAQGRRATLALTTGNANLLLRSDRTPDSVVLAVENPRRLPFWYYMYRGNTLVERGYGPELLLRRSAPSPEPWYVSVHYFWAGRLQTAEYNVPLPQHRLTVEAEQPDVVYPGQHIDLRYTVRDGGGRPVAGADLTSYAYTSKFEDSEVPEMPDFEIPVAGRMSLRRFRLGAGFGNDPQAATRQQLDWGGWRRRLGLDSLRFYQFLYPDYGAFYEYQAAPGGITQLTPFVVDSGRVQPTVAVYVDGLPVFVAAVNGEEPFALVADSGRHAVAIRTPDRLITLHDVYLRHLHKLTLSIDPNHSCHDLTVEKRGPLTPPEEAQLQRFLVLIDKADAGERVLLRQGNRLQPLGSGRPTVNRSGVGGYAYSLYDYHSRQHLYHLGGPFRPDSVLLRRTDGLRRRFLLEPLYRYTLLPELLKMRCVQGSEFGELGQAMNFSALSLADFAYTEADMKPRPATSYYRAPSPEPLLNNPYTTPTGQGRLVVRLPESPTDTRETLPPVLYTLLSRPTDARFVRLDRGQPQVIHALPAGRYRLALLLADSTILAPAADITIQPNGTTYVQLQRPDLLPNNPNGKALRRRFGRLVRERLPKPVPPSAQEIREARREIRVLMPVKPRPDWVVVRGRVTERTSGEGLPGVTVLLKGTTHGVSTSADGSFALALPPAGGTLEFSFVGYVRVEKKLPGGTQEVDVALNGDTKQLSEVVVTGYGQQSTRHELTASVSAVTSSSLAGKVAGVQISGAPVAAIMIRGNSAVSASAQPLYIVDGLPYTGTAADIDPSNIADIKVLKGPEAAATFGSRAANGVVIITTKNGIPGRPPGGLRPEEATGPDGLPLAGRDPRLALRRRFSDTGWWRPTLLTDGQGQARTTVTIPDDITGWDTFVLASDNHGRTGSATALLRSFKALLGELAAPRFLIRGDQAQVIGKTLNYLPDTVQVTTSFQVSEGPARTQAHRVATSVLDTLTLTAPADQDSVQVSFGLRQPNGYQDGELRTIPVLPAGTLERVGEFAVLSAADTTVTWTARPALGPVTVRLESDPLPTLLEEIRHVQRYAYLCNEQAASKLKTLLLEQRVRELQHQPFAYAKDVNRLIRKLQEGRRQPEGIWGTWPTSPVSPWATLHVLEALLQAQQQGYRVKLDQPQLTAFLLKQLDYAFADAAVRTSLAATPAGRRLSELYFQTDDDRIRLLLALHRLGAQPDFPTYVRRLEREPKGRQPLDRYLALSHLRQQLGLPFQLDTLRRYRLRTELGGVFYADTLRLGSYYRYLLPDRVGATLLAYNLLRAKGNQPAELTRIRTWLLNQRTSGGHWRSTYEAAQILETILPDLLVPGSGNLLARAQLSGSLTREITQFPFTATVPAAAGALTLRKQGGLPVYATAYQSYWNATPEAKATPFKVTTRLAGQEGGRVRLKAGQPTELEVTVNVPAEARYVLLEVPIPAGCSYGDKAPGNYFEVHREYLRHQVGIFMDVLPAGRHTFRVALQPRYRGRYTVNPAKAEMMYFPTKFGRSASKQAVVE